ncbi:MAG: hypothetical protein P8K76_15545 [Candidatus Binatia bacterium]|nr:hypothetical protein [Candidatus Binatia bacterium]MDG2011180.1 hypothetical protein [Candidatus Binatia bacterium]
MGTLRGRKGLGSRHRGYESTSFRVRIHLDLHRPHARDTTAPIHSYRCIVARHRSLIDGRTRR